MAANIVEATLRHLNEELWRIEPTAGQVDLNPFMDALFRHQRHFNMAQIARDCGLSRNTVWRILRRSHNTRFATLLRLCYYMGLRFRLEVDPVPRRLAFGTHKTDYKSKVDKQGSWDL